MNEMCPNADKTRIIRNAITGRRSVRRFLATPVPETTIRTILADAARAQGLETCAQQAWCEFSDVVRREPDIPESEILITGLALGHPDPDAPENALTSPREDVDVFTTFMDQ